MAYRRVSGQPGEPHIVCVTKMQPLSRILEAIDAGATEIGENYLQEAMRKGVFALHESHEVVVRYIGRLQSNKYNAILRGFDAVDSSDQDFLVHLHDIRDHSSQRTSTFLLEVNAGDEPQKGGLSVPQIRRLAEANAPWLQEISGLMAVVPLLATMQMRARLYESVDILFHELASDAGFPRLSLLSMGTSDDFELALAHGSNMIRVGTGIFGVRSPFQV